MMKNMPTIEPVKSRCLKNAIGNNGWSVRRSITMNSTADTIATANEPTINGSVQPF